MSFEQIVNRNHEIRNLADNLNAISSRRKKGGNYVRKAVSVLRRKTRSVRDLRL